MTQSANNPMPSPVPRRPEPRFMHAPAAVIDGFDLVFAIRTYDVMLCGDPRTTRLTLLDPAGVRVPVGRD